MRWIVVATLIAGCATTPVPVEVTTPVPTTCVTEIPAYPDLRATEAWNKNVFERAKALLIDRQLLVQHVETLRAMLEACKQ